MLPVVALVGRPNVGKSTLFNALTGTRDALVADIPGLTRDRKYGYGRVEPHRFIVVDTGGLVETPRGMHELMARQTARAIEEADRIVFLVDGQSGLDAADRFVADVLRRSGKPVTVAVNKSEDRDSGVVTAEFHGFGFGEPVAISAAHRRGIDDLRRGRARGHRAGRRRGRGAGTIDPRLRGRKAKRRQVDADQPARGRGARHHLRPARHDARRGAGAIRA